MPVVCACGTTNQVTFALQERARARQHRLMMTCVVMQCFGALSGVSTWATLFELEKGRSLDLIRQSVWRSKMQDSRSHTVYNPFPDLAAVVAF